MIVLTGDVHHMSLQTNDQSRLAGTEAESALDYANIAAAHGFKTTLFCSGQLTVEEPTILTSLGKHESVEIGGHNFCCYQPMLYHRICNKLLGLFHGPACHQRYEIRRTRKALSQYTRQTIKSWRNHAYLSDANTTRLLAEEGIQYYSDERNVDIMKPYQSGKLTHVPINIIPDHEHLYHGHRTPESVPGWVKKTSFHDCWGSHSLEKSAWAKQVVEEVRAISARGGVATLLIHPACMEVLDGFKTFTWILEQLQGIKSLWMKELDAPA